MQEYKQAPTFGKTNKSAKIPYTIDCTSKSFCQVWQ